MTGVSVIELEKEFVVAGPTRQFVFAMITGQVVIPRSSNEGVITVIPGNGIVAAEAIDFVGFAVANNELTLVCSFAGFDGKFDQE